jgi:cytochrome bd-type quinol oxidase subunit 2
MTGQDAFLFTAALTGGLTAIAVPLVALIQQRDFREVDRGGWRRGWRNAAMAFLAGLAAMAVVGVALPGRPLLETRGEANDLTVVTAMCAGLGLALLTTMAFNLTLYRAAGRIDARQAKWTSLLAAAIYALVAAGFGWAVLG